MKKRYNRQDDLKERKKSVLEPVNEIFAKHPLFSKRPMISVYKLQKSWTKLVGEMMAKRSLPIRVKKNCLIIAVENQAWGQQFMMMKPTLLQAISDQLNLQYEDIRFVSEPFERPEPKVLSKESIAINRNRSLEDILSSISNIVKNSKD